MRAAKVFRTTIAAGVLAAGLAGCSGPKRVTADEAWIRLPAAPGRPGAAYVVLHGGRSDATLIDASADIAVRTEMHESMTGAGGMAAMKPLGQVAVPAGGTVAFAPGGRHLMLFDINPRAKVGKIYNLTLNFANGGRLRVPATVVGPADPAPDF